MLRYALSEPPKERNGGPWASDFAEAAVDGARRCRCNVPKGSEGSNSLRKAASECRSVGNYSLYVAH